MRLHSGKTGRTILFVCDFNGHGGTQTHLMSLFTAMDRNLHRPWLATLNLEQDLARRLRTIDVEVTNLGLAGALRLRTVGAVRALAGEASRRGVDLIHGYLFSGNLVAAAISTLSGIPCMTSVRNIDIWKKRRHRVASSLAHRKARHVLFNSIAVRQQVARREWIEESKTSIIQNSVVDPREKADTKQTPAGLGFSGEPGGPIVVCVASLRRKKGHTNLLAGFKLVRNRIPGARLLLVGEGPERESLRRETEQAGLAHAVVFAGYREDVRAILARCDLFVLVSLEEGMPNALLEAMAAGLPSVVTNVGGNAEALADGTTGYLVPGGDPAVLAARMIEILLNPDLRRMLSEAARRRYETLFTLDKMTNAYQALYERLLGQAAE